MQFYQMFSKMITKLRGAVPTGNAKIFYLTLILYLERYHKLVEIKCAPVIIEWLVTGGLCVGDVQ